MEKFTTKYKYRVYVNNNMYYSAHRNSKRALQDHGGNRCEIYDKKGKLISLAFRDENGKIHNGYIGK